MRLRTAEPAHQRAHPPNAGSSLTNTSLPSGCAAPHLQTYPNKVHIHYTVDRAEDKDSWHGSVGHISKEMLKVGQLARVALLEL